MFAVTHKMIAQKVFDALNEELGIVLDRKSLLHGSIAPDLYPSMLFKSHGKKSSFEFVQRKIQSLAEEVIPANRKGLSVFSLKLGIIIHFVSDYFCKAHNESRYDNMLLHYIYERKLKRYFSRWINEYHAAAAFKKLTSWKPCDNIVELIEEKHREYTSLKSSLSMDMEYSIYVSTQVALNLIYQCMINTGRCLIFDESGSGLKPA